MGGDSGFKGLPGDCVAVILSMATPGDAGRVAAATTALKAAALSDVVWERFLPADYMEIVRRADMKIEFGSKKELFLLLCNSISIDSGNKIFKMDKKSGLKSYILSARELTIAWVDDPMFWSWRSIPESRFKEAAELRSTHWLEINGEIKKQTLSPNTSYGAYLIFKVSERSYGLDTMPMEVYTQEGNQTVRNIVCLREDMNGRKQQIERLFYSNRIQSLSLRVSQKEGEYPGQASTREDGWREVLIGGFWSGNENEVVEVSLREVKGPQLKGGLIVDGIEVRPLV